MRRQSVRFQYFLVLEQTAKATKTRTERASASCDDDDWASMRRVRARRRAICTCWCALVCVCWCVRVWAIWVYRGMQHGHVCGLWHEHVHVQAHVIYQTLDAPVCAPHLPPPLLSCHTATFPTSAPRPEPTFAPAPVCDTVAGAGVASSINAAADLFQQSTINLH